MSARSFLDSNLLVYTDDGRAPEKRAKALQLIERLRLTGTGVLSTQVLQEYFASATRKLGVPAAVARRKVEIFGRFDLVLIDLPDILAAIDLHRLHQFSIWDALILHAARQGSCKVVYSEDLQAGRRLGGLEIVNPFADTDRNVPERTS
jgi:predicted nucleic acid-binding protein